MNYTLEQKALAVLENNLWWRMPNGSPDEQEWSLIVDDIGGVTTEDLKHEDAVYFIGSTPPRVLSELEGELANALENLFALVMGECRQLLDEDSGGNSSLYMQITDALEKTKAPQ